MSAQQSRTNEGQRQQGSEQRGAEQRGAVARRGGVDPFAVLLGSGDLLRMNPFSLMRRMAEEIDRSFGDPGSGAKVWLPAIEVTERDGNYVIQAELPGLKPDEVSVQLAENAVVIEGEHKEEHEEDKGTVHRNERRYGRFFRTIPLPEGAKGDQARASFENGVLEVTVPVEQPRSKVREIPIEAKQAA